MSIEFVRMCYVPKCESEGTKRRGGYWVCKHHYDRIVEMEKRESEMHEQWCKEFKEHERKNT